MDKIRECFTHIQVIRGVNYGCITNENLRDMAIRYELDENEQKEILKMLADKGVYPIPEAEMPKVDYKSPLTIDEINEVKPDERRVLTKEEKQAILDRKFQKLCQKFKEEPEIWKQYLEELPMLQNAIVENAEKYDKPPEKIIEYSVMEISRYRVRDIRDKGWVCGTYMLRVRKSFVKWLKFYYSKDELNELILRCKQDNLDVEELIQLLLLLEDTPHTLVFPRLSKYLKNSDSDLNKSDSDLNKLGSDLNKSDTNLNKSDSDLNKSDSDLNKYDSDLNKSDTNLNKSDSDLNKLDSDLNKPGID